jgi:hypothetical protein
MKKFSCPGCGVGFRKLGGYTWVYAGWATIRCCVGCFMRMFT